MRFLKNLPRSSANLKINDVLDQMGFNKIIQDMDAPAREKAIGMRSWLIRIIISMFVVILLIIIVGVLSFIK